MESSATVYNNYGYDDDEVEPRTNSSVSDIALNLAQGLDNTSFQPDNEAKVSSSVIPAEVREPVKTQGSNKWELLYSVDDVPPWHTSAFLGFQYFIAMVGGTISVPYILAPLLCIDNSDPARGKLVSTIIFVSGMITLLQSTIGVRLPIVQGGSFSFLVPTITILTTKFEPCSVAIQQNMTSSEVEEVWQFRMREIQGAIIMASFFQIILGFTGIMGLLLKWITPLTVAPTITMVGLSLFHVAAEKASLNWSISITTTVLLIMFSQYLTEIPVPVPAFKKGSGCYISWFKVFKLYPVLLAIFISWGLCGILTAAGVLPEGNLARTDLNKDLVDKSPWFRIPYPGQWGLPTVSAPAVLGMVAGSIASIIESIGDYYACAKIAGAPPPPVHAVNRGIGIEGVGCMLAGLWGSGNGTTSYSDNIGVIGVTRVSSRSVVQLAAGIMMVFGVFGKFGAAMMTIPEPVVGGLFLFMFSLVVAVGLSILQYVNLSSTRNIFIVGISIFFALALPKWSENNHDSIQTGNETCDQILTMLLQTSMLVAAFFGFILDNTIPGTPEERGLLEWNSHLTPSSGKDEIKSDCYDIPVGMETIRRMTWTEYLPFCPTFTGWSRRKESFEA